MSGKCRPSLRAKTLENVKRCNLSETDKECIKNVFELAEKQQAAIERLRDDLVKQRQEIYTIYGTAKEIEAEAVKEFAERLKAKAHTDLPWLWWVDIKDIDNLLKEMVGEDND